MKLRKILAILLVSTLCISLTPVGAFAEGGSGSGVVGEEGGGNNSDSNNDSNNNSNNNDSNNNDSNNNSNNNDSNNNDSNNNSNNNDSNNNDSNNNDSNNNDSNNDNSRHLTNSKMLTQSVGDEGDGTIQMLRRGAPLGMTRGAGEETPSEGSDANITLTEASLTTSEEEDSSTGLLKKVWSTALKFISAIRYDMYEVYANNATDNSKLAIMTVEDSQVVWTSETEGQINATLHDYNKALPEEGRVFVILEGYRFEPVPKLIVKSNSLSLDIPAVGETTYNKTDIPTPVGPNGTSDNPGKKGSSDDENKDSNHSSSNDGNGVNTVVAIAVGNIKPGKKYSGQIVEFQALGGGSNGAGGNITAMSGGNGLDAFVSVDQGGNNFSGYSFDLMGGIAGNGAGAFNATVNTGGNKFSHSKNGLYYPEGMAGAEFMVDQNGVAVFTDGKNRLPGIYTVLFLDEDGRMAYIYIVVGGGAAPVNTNANMTGIQNGVGNEIDCSIIMYYSDGNINGTGTSMGGASAKFIVTGDGSKKFSDGVKRDPGTYLVTYLDKNGNPVNDYIVVPGGSGAGKGSALTGKAPVNDSNATMISDVNIGGSETECAIVTYYSDGNVNGTGTSMGGEHTKIRKNSDGVMEFCDGKQRPAGTYLVTYSKGGNPEYAYVIVPGAGGAGNGSGNGAGGAGDSTKGKGSDSSGLNMTGSSAGSYMYVGDVTGVTGATGGKTVIDPAYQKSFYFANGVPSFAVTTGMDPGVYDVTYTDYDGVTHDIQISVK